MASTVTEATVIHAIIVRFRERGATAYLGEDVSLSEHMIQAASLAIADGADPPLIAAALLHDYGHLLSEESDDAAEHGVDTRHEDLGSEFLSQYFPESVVEPIRMHVAAKRYLCATDAGYLAALSPASRLSLDLQGGPFSQSEIAEFQRSPYAQAAVKLRRYDDGAKSVSMRTPPIDQFRPLLERLLG